jgi:hypothetical protein
MVDMHFPDYDTPSAAVTTAEAGALFEKVVPLGTGGLHTLFSAIGET